MHWYCYGYRWQQVDGSTEEFFHTATEHYGILSDSGSHNIESCLLHLKDSQVPLSDLPQTFLEIVYWQWSIEIILSAKLKFFVTNMLSCVNLLSHCSCNSKVFVRFCLQATTFFGSLYWSENVFFHHLNALFMMAKEIELHLSPLATVRFFCDAHSSNVWHDTTDADPVTVKRSWFQNSWRLKSREL